MFDIFSMIRFFFVFYGALQTLLGLTILIAHTKSEAAKNAQEIPSDTTSLDTTLPKHQKIKALFMILFGIAFLTVAIISFITDTRNNIGFLIVMGIFSVYSFVDAIISKSKKTTAIAIITIIFTLIILFIQSYQI